MPPINPAGTGAKKKKAKPVVSFTAPKKVAVTRQQLRNAHAQQRDHVSQGKAVRRVAAQRTAARPTIHPDPVRKPTRRQTRGAKAQQKYLVSQGKQVERDASYRNHEVQKLTNAFDQERQHVDQGNAVEKAANKQRNDRLRKQDPKGSRVKGEFGLNPDSTVNKADTGGSVAAEVAKLLRKGSHANLAAGPAVGKQLQRTGEATRGAIDAVVTGHPETAAKRAIQGLTLKRHTSGTDIFKHAGWKPKGRLGKIARGAAGFTLEMVADPAPYARFGRATEAEAAFVKASRAARRAGKTETEAQAAGHAAAEGKATNRGVQVGFRTPVTGRRHMTSGKVTAKVSKLTGVSHVATKVRESKPAQTLGKAFEPDFRAKGVGEVEHRTRRNARRNLQAARTAAERKGNATKQAIKREVRSKSEREDLTASVERTPVEIPETTTERRLTASEQARRKRDKAKTAIQRAKVTEARHEGRVSVSQPREDRTTINTTVSRHKAIEQRRQEEVNARVEAEAPSMDELVAKHTEHITEEGTTHPSRIRKAAEKAATRERNAIVHQINASVTSGTTAAERRAGRHAEQFKKAEAALKGASIRRSNARKAYRNAFGEDPLGAPLPGPKRQARGNPDPAKAAAEQEKALEKWDKADANYHDAKAGFDAAKARLEKTSAQHSTPAGVARSIARPRDVRTHTSKLSGLQRRPVPHLGALEKAKAKRLEAETRFESAKGEIKAQKKAGTYTKKAKEPVLVTRDGKRYAEVRKQLPKVQSPHTQVEAEIRRRNDAMFEAEAKAGVHNPASQRPDYMHHVNPRDTDRIARRQEFHAEEEAGRAAALKKAGFGPEKQRQLEGSAREVNTRMGEKIFEEDAAAIQGHRTLIHHGRLARKQWADSITSTGKKVTPGVKTEYPEGYALYERSPNDNLTLVDTKKAQQVEAGRDAEGKKVKGDFYLLPHKNTQAALQDVERMSQPSGFWQRVQGGWKTAVTILSPSYWVGNNVGGRIQSWEADVSAHTWNTSRRMAGLWKARNRFEQGRLDRLGRHSSGAAKGAKFEDTLTSPKDKFLLREIELAEQHGGLSSGVHHEINNLTGRQPGALRRVSEAQENRPRMASWLEARRQGMSPDEAADWVNRHHIDYGDLTAAERQIRNKGIPFYTFWARNTKLQVTKLFEAPGKLANFEKAREDISEEWGGQDGVEFQNLLKSYQQAGMPFAVKVAGQSILFYGRTPIDLGLAGVSLNPADIVNNIGSRIGPQKWPFELAFNYDTFMREHIETPNDRDASLTEAPSWAASIPKPLQDLLQVQRVTRGPNKNVLVWRKAADKIMSYTPITKVAADLATKQASNRYGQTKTQTVVSFFGFKVSDLDPSRMKEDQIRTELTKVNNAVQKFGGRYPVKNPSDPKHDLFYSKEYQHLLDRQKQLQDALDKTTGKKSPKRLSRRPLSIDQQVQKKIAAKQKQIDNIDSYVRDQLRRRQQLTDLTLNP